MYYKSFAFVALISALTVSILIGLIVNADSGGTAKRIHLRLDTETKGPIAGVPESPLAIDKLQLKSFNKHPPSKHRVRVLDQPQVLGLPPRERHPELSLEQLVVIAVDAQEKEVTRVLIPDPRLIRAETVTSSGELTSEIHYQETADFTIVLPDDPRIILLKIYQPRWTGTQFILDPIGETLLP